MIKDDLSICIPTFNRAEKLRVLLHGLSIIICENIFELIILDNASSDHTAAVVQEFVPQIKCKVVYIKNDVNIGGNANVLRCFEKCKTKWAWIIGDDDTPEKNALDIIHKYLNEYLEDGLFINFSTQAMCIRKEDIVCPDFNSFFTNFDIYSNILFVSTSIFNTRAIIQYLQLAYQYVYSMAPHLVLVFCALNAHKGKVILAKDAIIIYGEVEKKEDKWSYFHLYLGMVTLIEIPKAVSDEAFTNFINKIISNVILNRILFDYLIKYYHNNPILRKYLFNQIVARNYRYFPGKGFNLRMKLFIYSLIINNDKILSLYIKYRKVDLNLIDYPINIQPLFSRL